MSTRQIQWRRVRAGAARTLKSLLFVVLLALTLCGVPVPIGPPPRPGAPRPQGAIVQLLQRKRRRKRRRAG